MAELTRVEEKISKSKAVKLFENNIVEEFGRRDDRVMNIGADIIASDYAWESAMWYWKYKTDKNGLNGTELVEAGATVRDITHFVNGGENGLKERQTAYGNFKWEE